MMNQTHTMTDSNRNNPVVTWLETKWLKLTCFLNQRREVDNVKQSDFNAESDSIQLNVDQSKVLTEALKNAPEPSDRLLSLFK